MGLGASDDDHLIIDWSTTTGDVTNGYGSYNTTIADGDVYGGFYNSQNSYGDHFAGFDGVERFTITTGSGNDNFTTGYLNDTISLGNGNDSVNTLTGDAYVDGGAGTDYWSARSLAETSDITLNLTSSLARTSAAGALPRV